ncbi:hypothetical protein ACLQ2M_41635, partial [Streptomyces sp. DT7]
LEPVLTGDASCAVIADADWTRMTSVRPSGLLAELGATVDAVAAAARGNAPTLRREVLALPEQARSSALLDAVRAQA